MVRLAQMAARRREGTSASGDAKAVLRYVYRDVSIWQMLVHLNTQIDRLLHARMLAICVGGFNFRS